MTPIAEHIKHCLAEIPGTKKVWVAYSGGCDSHVLLHGLASIQNRLGVKLAAIHINHGLSPDAGEWESHCADVCAELGITYQAITVNTHADIYEKCSPEEAARRARYAAWQSLIQDNEVILLAHHQDDQAETVLLQLFRGAGVKGLSAMPVKQDFAGGYLLRPLLGLTRQQLHEYAVSNNLSWISDPSNFDTDFDRNFLRHTVLPELQQRWPALGKTLSRTARHQSEADLILTEIAHQDYEAIGDQHTLSIDGLLGLSEPRQRNLLRYWLSTVCQCRLPDTVHLSRILNEVITAAADAMPEVNWAGGEVRRFQGCLYAAPSFTPRKTSKNGNWPNIEQDFVFSDGLTRLCARAERGQGLSQAKISDATVQVRFRQGGESCRPPARGQTHQLKKLFQEWQIPPWQRDNVPLIFVNDQLAQVVGYCIHEPFAAKGEEMGWVVTEQTGE